MLTEATITGLWHYAEERKSGFTKEIAEARSGKFGQGTYFGVGELKGETVDLLKAGDNVRHEVAFEGNVMVVDRQDVRQIAEAMRAQQGLPPSRVKSSIQNASLTNLSRGIKPNGQAIDAILVVNADASAELAVLPEAVSDVTVISTA